MQLTCVYIRKNHVRVCCLLNCLAFNCFEVNSSLSSCLSSVFLRFSLVHCSPVAAVTKTAAKFVLLDLLAPNPASLLLIADLDSLARPLPMRRSRMLVFSTIAQVRDNLIRAHVTYFRLQRHYNALFFRDCFCFDVPTPITWQLIIWNFDSINLKLLRWSYWLCSVYCHPGSCSSDTDCVGGTTCEDGACSLSGLW